jgi:hypothetical protein
MPIFTKAFWSYAGERALKTVAQTAISLLTVAGVTGVLDVTWIPVASAVALSGILSILTSVTSYTGPTVAVTEDGYTAVARGPLTIVGETAIGGDIEVTGK